jgi:hypothetical protein
MLKEFDGHMFNSHGTITTFPIELGGEIVSIEVEVVFAPLDYNLLLGCSWFYAMTIFVSSIFKVLHFPYEGKLVTIDQLSYYMLDYRTNIGENIPFINGSIGAYDSVQVLACLNSHI